jgi:hypothetical protein
MRMTVPSSPTVSYRPANRWIARAMGLLRVLVVSRPPRDPLVALAVPLAADLAWWRNSRVIFHLGGFKIQRRSGDDRCTRHDNTYFAIFVMDVAGFFGARPARPIRPNMIPLHYR